MINVGTLESYVSQKLTREAGKEVRMTGIRRTSKLLLLALKKWRKRL